MKYLSFFLLLSICSCQRKYASNNQCQKVKNIYEELKENYENNYYIYGARLHYKKRDSVTTLKVTRRNRKIQYIVRITNIPTDTSGTQDFVVTKDNLRKWKIWLEQNCN